MAIRYIGLQIVNTMVSLGHLHALTFEDVIPLCH